jgi:WD40 repeat protein
MAFTKDGSQLVVLFANDQGGSAGDAQITIRDAATLEPVGLSVEPEVLVNSGNYVGSYFEPPGFALMPDGRSAVIATDEARRLDRRHPAGLRRACQSTFPPIDLCPRDELVWWNLRRGTPTRQLAIGTGQHALALSPDAGTIAVGVHRGIQLVDTRSGAVRTAAGALGGAPSWLVFSPDGATVVSTSLDGTVALWDVDSATRRETLRGHSAAVQQPVFSPDGRTLYTVSHDGAALAWDIGGDRGLGRRFTFTHEDARALVHGQDSVESNFDGHPGSFSPDGRLVALGLNDHGIGLWDPTDLTPVGPPLSNTGGPVFSLAIAPDGGTLAAVTREGLATLWDVDAGYQKELAKLRGENKAAYVEAAKSRLLLPRLSVWPVARAHRGRERERKGPPLPWGNVLGVSISADGKLLATLGPRGIDLWEVATGEALPEWTNPSAHPWGDTIALGRDPAGGVAFSPAGSMLAFVHDSGGTVEIWDVARRSRITKLPVDTDSRFYYAIAFSPDGRTLATGGLEDPIVRVWDVATGKLIRELDQGSAAAKTLDFSPDGQTLAVSGYGPVASLWDLATGARIGPTLTAGSRRADIDFSPDGRELLMTAADGRGAIWDVDPESWAQRACRLANRTLTPDEWEEFLPGRSYDPACAT